MSAERRNCKHWIILLFSHFRVATHMFVSVNSSRLSVHPSPTGLKKVPEPRKWVTHPCKTYSRRRSTTLFTKLTWNWSAPRILSFVAQSDRSVAPKDSALHFHSPQALQAAARYWLHDFRNLYWAASVFLERRQRNKKIRRRKDCTAPMKRFSPCCCVLNTHFGNVKCLSQCHRLKESGCLQCGYMCRAGRGICDCWLQSSSRGSSWVIDKDSIWRSFDTRLNMTCWRSVQVLLRRAVSMPRASRSHCVFNKMLQSTSRKGRSDSFVKHATGDPRLRPKSRFRPQITRLLAFIVLSKNYLFKTYYPTTPKAAPKPSLAFAQRRLHNNSCTHNRFVAKTKSFHFDLLTSDLDFSKRKAWRRQKVQNHVWDLRKSIYQLLLLLQIERESRLGKKFLLVGLE